MTAPPLDRLLTMTRMPGGIDVDHPPAPSGLGEDPRSHCADDPELVDPTVECRKGEWLHGLTVPGVCGATLPCGSIPKTSMGWAPNGE